MFRPGRHESTARAEPNQPATRDPLRVGEAILFALAVPVAILAVGLPIAFVVWLVLKGAQAV